MSIAEYPVPKDLPTSTRDLKKALHVGYQAFVHNQLAPQRVMAIYGEAVLHSHLLQRSHNLPINPLVEFARVTNRGAGVDHGKLQAQQARQRTKQLYLRPYLEFESLPEELPVIRWNDGSSGPGLKALLKGFLMSDRQKLARMRDIGLFNMTLALQGAQLIQTALENSTNSKSIFLELSLVDHFYIRGRDQLYAGVEKWWNMQLKRRRYDKHPATGKSERSSILDKMYDEKYTLVGAIESLRTSIANVWDRYAGATIAKTPLEQSIAKTALADMKAEIAEDQLMYKGNFQIPQHPSHFFKEKLT